MAHHTLIEVLSSQMGVTVRCEHFENSLVNGQDGHIEGSSTKVVHQDVLFLGLLVQAVGNRGGGGLVDDAEHVEAGNGSSVLGGLALGIVEVGGHGHHSVLDLPAQEGFGDRPHLGEDHC
mmetsp:Transcript_19994/g.22321  ORF Transcript_19994/g.22321 Transcript_19994/m.22321 type:complete len:120 (+) Transcript_19994:1250-1609(+)